MASDENPGISLEDLALEPIVESPVEAPRKGPAKFQIDTRGGGERRKTQDRRAGIRFEDERRSNKDRRVGSNPWAPGVDI
jgi:hypothetical protein